jgi:predicted transcriptional regulator
MVNQKPAKQINAQKWQRMKLILKELSEKPLTSNDITKLVFKTAANRSDIRTIQNYLAELIGLELISYDSANGVYSSNKNKIVFQSKEDYEIALKHSQLLVLTTKDRQGLDSIEPFFELRRLTFSEDYRLDVEDERFLQHLKTGYYDIIQLMEKYKQRFKELGLNPNYDHSPKYLEELLNPSRVSENEKRVRQDQELLDMRDLLIGRIYSLVDRVKHGIPLEGSCDACPGRYFSVKEG